ncbi:MAG: hypothetical protein O3B65_00180 [Chloroflexi bacterium]|nr:hypothetical protein [Chloroflexota bacterium]
MMLEQVEHYAGPFGLYDLGSFGMLLVGVVSFAFAWWLLQSWRAAKAAPSVARSMMAESAPLWVPTFSLSRSVDADVRSLTPRIFLRRVPGRRVRARGARAPGRGADDDGDGPRRCSLLVLVGGVR